MIRFLATSNGINSKLRTSYGKNALSMAKPHRRRPSNASRNALQQRPPLLRNWTRPGGVGRLMPLSQTRISMEHEDHGQVIALAWGVVR